MFAKTKHLAGAAATALAVLCTSAVALAQGPSMPSSGLPAPRLEEEEMTLPIGEQRVIPSDGVKSFSEAVRGIVDVRLTKDATQFVVVALKPGTTTLLLLMLDGSERHVKITVTDPNAQRSARDPSAVEARDNIRLDFYFVQVSKSYQHQIGIGWPGSVAPTFDATYNVAAGTLDSATAVIANQPLPRLDMAQATGWAKVMRQAAVVTANGEKATFAGGGEVNVAIQTALTSGIQKIPFGSVIEVQPRYDSKTGRVELRLHADISELDSDRGTGVPGRVTSALDTIVNLELGQSLILAGLTAKSQRRSMTGLPGLSQIPVLGIFFGSHAQAEEESENVVLIIPSVVDAVSMENRERLEAALETYKDYTGDIDEVSFVPPPRMKPARPVAPANTGAR
ncbi:MAG TPA: pilus assembly protein N-terminal domain-containing protein [Polyangiaceae bacterium]|jgi:pilus assembly protein CpaC|nr:pilus assembly protein N-terminal domain-containing protein [Polyangiaceae bacterium]